MPRIPSIGVSQESLANLRRWHGIRQPALFSRVARNDPGLGGDVDALVQSEPGGTPGWKIVDIEAELSGVFGGRRVDMTNRRDLNRRLRDRVPASAVMQYEAVDAARRHGLSRPRA